MRVSFAGGFADVAAIHGCGVGKVISVTVSLYSTIVVEPRVDSWIVASYSELERVSRLDSLRNDLFRETLRATGFDSGIEIHSIGSVPLTTSGMGGSSAAAVGLVHALTRLSGMRPTPRYLAERASDIEIGKLGRKIGKQDHYATAFGGLNVFSFEGKDVEVQALEFDELSFLKNRIVLVPVPVSKDRDAARLLDSQRQAGPEIPMKMSALVPEALQAFHNQSISDMIRILDEGWELKKKLSPQVTTPETDQVIGKIREMGGAGKLNGAGGGGYVMAILPDGCASDALSIFPDSILCEFEPEGSQIRWDDWGRE